MKRVFTTVIVLLLSLAQTLNATRHNVEYRGLRATTVEAEITDDTQRRLAVDMKKELKEEYKEEKERLKEKIECLKEETKALKEEYKQKQEELKQGYKELLEELEQDTAEDFEVDETEVTDEADPGDEVCKDDWVRSTGGNVNCVGGNFCYDEVAFNSSDCTLDCNEPNLGACDPDDPKCCDVCPCCDGCYTGSTPDKCLAETITMCECYPSECCATYSCDVTEDAMTKDEAKEEYESQKEELEKKKEEEIDQIKYRIDEIKDEIERKKEELKEDIKNLDNIDSQN